MGTGEGKTTVNYKFYNRITQNYSISTNIGTIKIKC